MASLESLDQVTSGNHPAVPLSSRLPVIAFGMLELPSGLAGSGQMCWHMCLLYSAEWCHAWCWAFLSSCYMQTPGGLCPSWLFQSFLFHSLIYLCPHFVFLSKLGTCPAILSMQLLSVLIQPQPPATLPSVHGWVSTLSSFLVGHMALGSSFHQRLELWWGCAAGRSALFNTYAPWKCADKNCFSYLP